MLKYDCREYTITTWTVRNLKKQNDRLKSYSETIPVIVVTAKHMNRFIHLYQMCYFAEVYF